MSKLIDKLERTTEAQVTPLGFGAARARQKSAPMLAIARLAGPESKAIQAVREAADALLVAVEAWDKKETARLRQLAGAAGSTPWGVAASALTPENVASLAEMGCDFVLFEESTTPAAVLDDEKVGKVLKVDASAQDSHLRMVERLPIGAVVADLGEMSALTVRQVLACRRVAALVRKPLLVPAPASLSSQELQALCRAGVKGLVIDAEAVNSVEMLSRLKEAIANLPAPRKPGADKERFHALLPSVPGPAATEPEEEDGEEEG